MKPTRVTLDQTYSSFDNENIEKWREQSRSNEQKISETLKAAGFTDECVGFAIGFYNAKKFCVAEQDCMGVRQFIAVVWDSNDNINVEMYFKTPEAFYGGQGLGAIYQSGRDPRFESLQKEFWKVAAELPQDNPKESYEKAKSWIDDQMNSLRYKVWEEKIGLLYKAVGCEQPNFRFSE